MSWLLAIGLKNAILALPLAALALAASRWLKRPALAHLLWAVVLIKLVTPPLIDVPVGWRLDVESWLAASAVIDSNVELPPFADRKSAASRQAFASNPARASSRDVYRGSQIHGSFRGGMTNKPTAQASWLTAARSWLFTPGSWPVIAAAIWAAGSLWLVGLFVWRGWQFCRYLRWATGRNEYLGPRVAELAHSVGLTIPPRVIVVDGIVSPMLWGLGQRACLIFPSQLVGRLSPANLDSLLLHELAHYWRGDHWMRALEMAACTLFWWNPVVWWARREIEAAEEECCDAWVVEHQRGTRHSYAEALLTTIDFLCERPEALPPAACGLGDVQLLRLRLTQIMRGDVAAGVSRWLQLAVIAGGIVISPLEPALLASSVPRAATTSTAIQPPAGRSAQTSSTTRLSHSGQGSRSARSSAAKQLPSSKRPAATRVSPMVPAPRPTISLWGTAVSPDGRHRLEARSGGRILLAGTPDAFRVDLSAHQIRCASFAPDSDTFATGHPDALVRLWESESGGLKASLQGSQAAITTVHISPDGLLVAAGAADGGVLVWDIASGDVIAQLPPGNVAASCVRWSKQGDRLAVTLGSFVDHERSSLVVWRPHENIVVHRQRLPKPAGAIDWLGEGSNLIVADWSGQGTLWDLDSADVVGQWQVDKTLVSAAAWSPDCPLVSRLLADHFFPTARPESTRQP